MTGLLPRASPYHFYKTNHTKGESLLILQYLHKETVRSSTDPPLLRKPRQTVGLISVVILLNINKNKKASVCYGNVRFVTLCVACAARSPRVLRSCARVTYQVWHSLRVCLNAPGAAPRTTRSRATIYTLLRSTLYILINNSNI
uniref:Uncharacterized protein n=1 Tax=Pararge aegeria TaxID=116150 RepID=S4PTG5_9NEOP